MTTDLNSLKAQFEQQGYLVIEDLYPKDFISRLRTETGNYVDSVAKGVLSGELLDIFAAQDGVPQLRRIASPEKFAPVYDEAMRYAPLLDIVQALLGGTVRFDHGKLNFKPPSGGAAVEWHQDWAFYPQTNDDMLAVGIMIEDCTLENGPLMVIPGSHKRQVFDHHHNGCFVGGIDAQLIEDELKDAVPLTAKAGSVSIHHVRMLHGSTANQSANNRPLLLFNYVAVDAFPVFHSFDWEEFNQRILRGDPTFTPRMTQIPVRVPNPTPKPADEYATGSLFELQQSMAGALYSDAGKT